MDVLGQYLKEIAKFPLLTLEQERKLVRRAERGSKAAQRKLVEHNLRLVVTVSKWYTGIPFEDRIQHGNRGLMIAAERMRSKHGTRFSTYATWWIRQCIGRAIADEESTIRVPVCARRRAETAAQRELVERARNVEPMVWGDSNCDRAVDPSRVFADAIRNENAEYLHSRLQELHPRLQRILLARAGGDTLESLTAEFGVTRERVRQLEKQGLKKLACLFGRERPAMSIGEVLRGGGRKR